MGFVRSEQGVPLHPLPEQALAIPSICKIFRAFRHIWGLLHCVNQLYDFFAWGRSHRRLP
jgi:hypothetical protein